jgi:V8-like Glu-specific endopeptidase
VFVSLSACGGAGPEPDMPPGPIAPRPGSEAGGPGDTAKLASGGPLTSDEGMWTFDNFPSDRLGKRHGFAPSQEWLHHARLASVRLAEGCSGSFVSPNGLVLTNHHCAHTCIEQLSSKGKDFIKAGFYAAAEKDEVKCPEIEVNQLTEIKDVTARVNAATQGKSGAEYIKAQKAELSKIEKEACTTDDVRCDVVSLYHGGLYHLYRYRRFQDVRLVFAPELAIAFFGGDPDNFMFPRYDLDLSFLRVYDNNKPAKIPHYFKWSATGAKPGDLSFVAGNPAHTSRLATIAELEYQRDVALPGRLIRLAETRGVLTEFQHRGPEQKRVSAGMLFQTENALKALLGRHRALTNAELWSSKVEAEQALRGRVNGDAKLKPRFAGAWDAIAGAQRELRNIRKQYTTMEQGLGFWSTRFDIARDLVRASEELPKANELRLREYADSNLPALKQKLFSAAPLHDEFEIRTLTLSLTRLREELGPDHPFVKKVLGKDAPLDLATALVKGTKLGDVKARKTLFDGGKAAVDASKDPMIDLARRVDPDARAIRKKYEDDVESVVKKNSELIAKAQFEVYGTSVYPDATFTPRLSFGKVVGWQEEGKPVEPLTTLRGAFERHTGKEPFALPKSWLDAKEKLKLDTPFNFCTTNDIIGGNSGSPVFNKEAEIIGLIFDGNIHSLGGEYAFDEASNRAVAVHSAAIVEALDKVYNAQRLLADLRGEAAATPAAPAAPAKPAAPAAPAAKPAAGATPAAPAPKK